MRLIGKLCTCGNTLSRLVLMVVRLDHLPTPLKQRDRHKSYLQTFSNLAGDNSEEATPDPIPNSEVKLFCVDGTAWVTMWESRTSPAFFVFARHLLRRRRCLRRLRGKARALLRRLGTSNLLTQNKKTTRIPQG